MAERNRENRPHLQTEQIASLLHGFHQLSLHGNASNTPNFRQLIEKFIQRSRNDQTEAIQHETESHILLRTLLTDFAKINEQTDAYEADFATGFDILEVLGVSHSEIRHSLALGWLLDRHRNGRGNHAQGNLGFRLFLQEFGMPDFYAKLPYHVLLEVAGKESRVDLEIYCRGAFLIQIENKILASEGIDQTDREWRDLCLRGYSHCVTPEHINALFLTLNGELPQNPHFRPISWRQIAKVVERFSDLSRPAEVKLFASHYANSIRKLAFNARS